MLALTDRAESAIDEILASRELPDDAGLRITTETAVADGSAPQRMLRIDVVEGPQEGDQVVEDSPVYLDPEAGALLDDKLLDADVQGDQIRFGLQEQEQT